jgi:adenylosuccinate lyase
MIPFASVLLGGVVSTDEMQAIWSESNLLEKWILVERTITECQAELGMIPAEAAADILASLTVERISPEAVLREARKSGHLIVAFLRAFREICGPAAEHFHLGPTTQDILDTGLTLQISEAHRTWMLASLELEEACACGPPSTRRRR